MMEKQIPKRDYERTLELVRERTRPDRPPVMTQLDLVGRMVSAGIGRDHAERLVENLVGSNRLLRWEHQGRRWVCLNDVDRMERALVHHGERKTADEAIVAELYHRIQRYDDSQ